MAASAGSILLQPDNCQTYTSTASHLFPARTQCEHNILDSMRRWNRTCTGHSLGARRHSSQIVRAPLATNKQLLADLKKVRQNSQARKDEGPGDGGDTGLEPPCSGPVVQAQLPHSPLMFRFIGRRTPQTKVPKPQQQAKDLSPFQQKLRSNIYGKLSSNRCESIYDR